MIMYQFVKDSQKALATVTIIKVSKWSAGAKQYSMISCTRMSVLENALTNIPNMICSTLYRTIKIDAPDR